MSLAQLPLSPKVGQHQTSLLDAYSKWNRLSQSWPYETRGSALSPLFAEGIREPWMLVYSIIAI
jgi:hypothetical protein